MTHPLTPPPELLQLWKDQYYGCNIPFSQFLIEVAQWGADQELEACCDWIREQGYHPSVPRDLHAARRPKPPSLKELALQALSEAVKMADDVPPEGICSGQADTIRRALEALSDD